MSTTSLQFRSLNSALTAVVGEHFETFESAVTVVHEALGGDVYAAENLLADRAEWTVEQIAAVAAAIGTTPGALVDRAAKWVTK